MSRIATYFLTALVISLFFATNVGASVIAIPSQRFYDDYVMFNNSEIKPALERFTKILGDDFNIVAKECGVINAYYSKQNKTITLCYEYLADGDKYIEQAYKNENIATQANLKTGIFFYVLLHEFGHAAIDIKNIPVMGGEEDAADKIAAIILLEFAKSNPQFGKSLFVGFLSYNWNKRFGMLTKLLNSRNLYADEHPFNEQRVFNTVCLAYGYNPGLFIDIAQAFKLPDARAVRCQEEYIKANNAVKTLLEEKVEQTQTNYSRWRSNLTSDESCVHPAQCASGLTCINGHCKPYNNLPLDISECQYNFNCPGPQNCINNKCIPISTILNTERNSTNEQNSTQWKTDLSKGEQCKHPAQCSRGLTCIDGKCLPY
ncbi:MAG: DUF4344 domain-containing metallopeptidase [Gallionellaceae bacterium]|nr:DUF4344 domain-containing metallopeptidase [Gallionellaceae bacterium]